MRNIVVKVKPRSRKSKVEKIDEKYFFVWTKNPPKDGLANEEAAELIAKYFNIPSSRILLERGFSSRIKFFKIFEERAQ